MNDAKTDVESLPRIYKYRGYQCAVSFTGWCVCGSDKVTLGGGVLEWCVGEDDARAVMCLMSASGEFENLHVLDQRETVRASGYPTLADVESASLFQIGSWYRFLGSPGASAIYCSREVFELVRKTESTILRRIEQRLREGGGMTPQLSKQIGW